ncbi:ATP-binding cassette domain-containing protein [Nonomuraea phyllanthi]|uniref:ABC-type quaternary amine transporter n=1 Tax=Nonomuraea phyllanthi TaxID=2219224 RepID=A0A5C4WRG1_9ACTN|nr:ABC transporter ATP-binding protein [Nonomuraea phyllanthi]KAB8195778.1 ATP-binding cassette domain-containing protein [Nonomuraea phyllanthi]QFY07233.1 ATP-binding cassette domain-containing protein [Nonomuraea phyllanthi]
MSLRIEAVSKVLGGRTIVDSLDLEVETGQLASLLGPSGCGKTTTLRMIGGFLRPDAGQVLIDGQDVTAIAPERRPTAMVFQNYALWPHMTVFKNIAFGLKLRRMPRDEIRSRVEDVLRTVNLLHHIDSHPGQISGGEQQRVALARALVLEPKVLLLDEPLSNLDAKLRERVRDDIREIQQRVGITTVLVTHDQDEALSISDKVAVMTGGRIDQYDPPSTIYRAPRTRFVADFVGTMNLLRATVHDDHVATGDVKIPVRGAALGVEGEWDVGVRPEDVRVSPSEGAPAQVARVIPRGHYTELVLMLGEQRLRAFVGPGSGDDLPEGATAHIEISRALLYREGLLHQA